MSGHEEIAGALPWYVNGTASDTERAAVEAHLDGCERCRETVEVARDLVRALAHDPLLGHPRAEALVDRALDLGSLDADEAAALDAHLDRCPVCREAADELRATLGPPAPGAGADRADGEPSERGRKSGLVRAMLPDWLTATVLHPAAALAYLALLAGVVPLALRGDREAAPPAAIVAPVRLHDPGAMRGEGETGRTAVRVELGPASPLVAFDLVTDLDLDPWNEDGTPRASIATPSGETLWSAPIERTDVDDVGVVRLIVSREVLAGRTRLEVRIDGPDGRPRFRAPIDVAR